MEEKCRTRRVSWLPGGAAELLSRLLQFPGINNPSFFYRASGRAEDFTLTPFWGANARAGIPSRWSYLRVDKRLFIQRGRKLIRDAASLHFPSVPFLKGDLRRHSRERKCARE